MHIIRLEISHIFINGCRTTLSHSSYCRCPSPLSNAKLFNFYPNILITINFLLYSLKMPFYAVAVGRVPGVYNSWNECEIQTKGFPKPRFRKFSTESEAWSFVRSNKDLKSDNITQKSTSILIEDEPTHGKASSRINISLGGLNKDALSLIAEKLDVFVEQTQKKLGEFSNRLDVLEAKVNARSQDCDCKRKVNCLHDDIGEDASKKQKVADDQPVSEATRTTRSKTNATDEVEGPHRSLFYPPPVSGFIMDHSGHVIVFTDGACSNNGKGGAKAGVGVWFNHNHPFNLAAPVDGSATNNNAEIQAATRAIEQANLAGVRKINIHTDSQFMINCMTQWIPKWKKNNWKTVNGAPVKNKEQLVVLDTAIKTLDSVQWTHVRGHQGLEGNECADALARSGAAMYR